MTRTIILSTILSLLPISELRGAIPYAYIQGIPLWISFVFCTLVNMTIPLWGFLFLGTIHNLLDHIGLYHRIFTRLIEKARNKVSEKVSKYGLLGLMLFVAIPLPITGAWTGTLGAWVLGLDRKKSSLFIMTGVLIAGIIITTVVLTGAGIGSLFTKTINI